MSVGIIGAGFSGIATAKAMKEYGFEDITVLEKGSTIGGGWSKEGFAPDEIQTNISHHTCLFSDFQWKEDAPDFPNRTEFHEYLCDYATTFKIHPHVRLQSEVQKVYQQNGKWAVEWLHRGDVQSQVFDHVVVCSGIFSKAFIPDIPGIDTFNGQILHSREYRNPDPFAGKSVAVIGNAFSGCEIASDIATKTDKVIHVFRRPMWILSRYLQKKPIDLLFYSRISSARSFGQAPEVLNFKKNNWFQSVCSRQAEISSDLTVTSPFSAPSFVTITDSYLTQVANNSISLKKETIEKVEGDHLVFQDGSCVQADALVFCTGYQTAVPFFDQDVLNILGYRPDDQLQPLLLHKTVFPPATLPGLAFVGMYRGPFIGGLELQARWAAGVFSGKIPAPTKEEIEQGIEIEKEIRQANPRPQFPHGNYVEMCEDLAAQIGVLPNFERMKDQNCLLYHRLWDGPFTTASYRLEGFGKNPEVALKIIEKVHRAAKV